MSFFFMGRSNRQTQKDEAEREGREMLRGEGGGSKSRNEMMDEQTAWRDNIEVGGW